MDTASLINNVDMLTRARRIVEMAAARTKDRYTRVWLTRDENGFWEKNAAEYLDSTAERATALGLDAPTVDREIANQLLVLALSAVIRNGAGR